MSRREQRVVTTMTYVGEKPAVATDRFRPPSPAASPGRKHRRHPLANCVTT